VDSHDLLHRDGWITFIYPDKSAITFRTTLNEDMLSSVGGVRDGFLFDLDKLKWVEVPTSTAVKVAVTEERPILGEVNEFVSKFI
jgi:hypothetical protein